MKKIITLLLSLIISFSVLGQQPESDAIYVKIIKEYTLHEDGSMEYRYYKKLRLNTHFSFNRLYGETFIVYDPNFQDLKIKKALVTQKNGTVVPSPENAFNEVLPRFAVNAPYFNHLREMVVTHAGLELDAVIELDYTIHTKAGYYPALMAYEVLTEASPIAEEIILVRIPSTKALNYKVYQSRTEPEMFESAGHKEYIFTFTGIGENTHEKYQASNSSRLPGLAFSSNNLAEAQQFLSNQEALQYKTDEQLQAVVSNLQKDSTNAMDLILKLQKIVANDVNTNNTPSVFAGFKARSPIDVWKSNGGTPFEKSILLVTLLREAGIHAEPLAILPTVQYDEGMGCLPQITQYLVQVNPLDREQMILSPIKSSDQNLIYSLNGYTLLELNPSKLNIYTIQENFGNKLIMNCSINLNDSMKITGSADLIVFEKANPYYKLLNDSSSTKKLIGGSISTKDISSYSIINTAQARSNLSYQFEAKDSLKHQKNYYFFELPVCTNGVESWHMNYLNSDRKTDFEIPFPLNEQYSFSITLPENMKLINPVEIIEQSTDFGKVIISNIQSDTAVTVKRMFEISKNTIPVSSYQEFKAIMDIWNEKKYRELVFKKD